MNSGCTSSPVCHPSSSSSSSVSSSTSSEQPQELALIGQSNKSTDHQVANQRLSKRPRPKSLLRGKMAEAELKSGFLSRLKGEGSWSSTHAILYPTNLKLYSEEGGSLLEDIPLVTDFNISRAADFGIDIMKYTGNKQESTFKSFSRMFSKKGADASMEPVCNFRAASEEDQLAWIEILEDTLTTLSDKKDREGVESAAIAALDSGAFPNLGNSKSLLKKHMTETVFKQLSGSTTDGGVKLTDCIASGVKNLDSEVGVYAGDKDCYSVFSPLFNPIIKDHHKGFTMSTEQPTDFDASGLDVPNLDTKGSLILSTRIGVSRNLVDFGFTSTLSKDGRLEVETKVVEALNLLDGELKGTYHSLNGMSDSLRDQLAADGLVFEKGDLCQEAAGMNRDWPEGRGVFHNEDKSFLVWVNEEDQLRIVSKEKGGDFLSVFTRLSTAIDALTTGIEVEMPPPPPPAASSAPVAAETEADATEDTTPAAAAVEGEEDKESDAAEEGEGESADKEEEGAKKNEGEGTEEGEGEKGDDAAATEAETDGEAKKDGEDADAAAADGEEAGEADAEATEEGEKEAEAEGEKEAEAEGEKEAEAEGEKEAEAEGEKEAEAEAAAVEAEVEAEAEPEVPQTMVKGKLEFVFDPLLGHLTSCPTKLGTGLRVTVSLKLAKAPLFPEFQAICDRHQLVVEEVVEVPRVRGGSVYVVSGRQCLGLSEVECVQQVYDGVKAVLELEREMLNVMPTFPDECNSLVKKYLTPEVWAELRETTTETRGLVLLDCINSGVVHADTAVGAHAGDGECYEKFGAFFNPMIEELHAPFTFTVEGEGGDDEGEGKEVQSPEQTCMMTTMGGGGANTLTVESLDPSGKYVISTRMRVSRNLAGFGLNPSLSHEDRLEVERKCVAALNSLQGDLAGTYCALGELTEEARGELMEGNLLFQKGDRVAEAAGLNHDWPAGRGVFHNEAKTFLVWVNEEDQLRITSMQVGGDVSAVLARLVTAVNAIEKHVGGYNIDKRLGHLTSSPANLGTGLRASVHMHIPAASQAPEFQGILEANNCQVRSVDGQPIEGGDEEAFQGVVDISSHRRLGLSALECATNLANGVAALVALERKLTELPDFPDARESLVKKHLTEEMFAKYGRLYTAGGVCLRDCVKAATLDTPSTGSTGSCGPHADVGLYAGDQECYTVYAPLFNAVIQDLHGVDVSTAPDQAIDYNPLKLDHARPEDLDPDGDYIISCTMVMSRNLSGFPLPPAMTAEDRATVEERVREKLVAMGEGGKYYSFGEMDEETKAVLEADEFLFDDKDAGLVAAGVHADFPNSRGVYHSEDKNMLAWVNHEDHIHLSATELGANLVSVMTHLSDCLAGLDELDFQFDPKLGYVTSSPANIGTTLHCSVILGLPYASLSRDFDSICDQFGLFHDLNLKTGGCVLSTRRVMGVSEVECVQGLVDGMRELIKLDKKLAVVPEFGPEATSHLSKHLTPELFAELKFVHTSNKVMLQDCIASGVQKQETSKIGLYAGDEECYTKFDKVFNPVLEDLNPGFSASSSHRPDLDPGHLAAPALDEDLFTSTRISVARNLKGHEFTPTLSQGQRAEVEAKIVEALNGLEGELAGTYYSLSGLDDASRAALEGDKLLFPRGDDLMEVAGINRDWPEGRGVFHNEAKSFLVWVNQEDQLRITSVEANGDIGSVFTRLCTALTALDEKLGFVLDPRLGYISTCPSKVGTGMSVVVDVNLPNVGHDEMGFKEICDIYSITPSRQSEGVFQFIVEGRLGVSEIEALQQLHNCLKALVEFNTQLSLDILPSTTPLKEGEVRVVSGVVEDKKELEGGAGELILTSTALVLKQGEERHELGLAGPITAVDGEVEERSPEDEEQEEEVGVESRFVVVAAGGSAKVVLAVADAKESSAWQEAIREAAAAYEAKLASVSVEQQRRQYSTTIRTTGTLPSFPSDYTSLMVKHLTPSVAEELKDAQTANGVKLVDVVVNGVFNPSAKVGVHAGDAESYTTFGPLLHPIIEELHAPFTMDQTHPAKSEEASDEEGGLLDAPRLDPRGRYIYATRAQVSRNLKGFELCTALSRAGRLAVEGEIVDALNALDGELSGTYYSLGSMDEETRSRLAGDHFLFKREGRYLEPAGMNRHYPEGRGVFHNDAKTFLVWVNEEDQLCVTSMEQGGDVESVFVRLSGALLKLDEKLGFLSDDTLGYLNSCPTNLGTALTVTLTVHLPTATAHPNFASLCKEHHLNVTKVMEGTYAGEESTFQISNSRCLGLKETEVYMDVYNGVKALIGLENEVALGDFPAFKVGNMSLLVNHLTPSMWEEAKLKETSNGIRLYDCIVSGVENTDSGCGLYAGDMESYKLFEPLMAPVIRDCHPGADLEKLSKQDLTPSHFTLPRLDPDGKYILSTRIRVTRNLADYPLSIGVTPAQRLSIEASVKEALDHLNGGLSGTYHSLSGMPDAVKAQLEADDMMMSRGDRYKQAAGMNKHWPQGRGVFHNKDNSLLVWVNGEDQLRIASIEQGGNFKSVFARLCNGVSQLSAQVPFSRDSNLGYISSCPTNLGTGLRASVRVRLPRVSKSNQFGRILDEFSLEAVNMDVANKYGPVYEEGGVFTVGNKRRLGVTEVEAVTEMYNGVKALIELERDMTEYPHAQLAPSDSLMKKHLSEEVFHELSTARTANGVTLLDCITSGLQEPSSDIGLYVGDAESYTTFSGLLTPMIQEFHNVTLASTQPRRLDASALEGLEPLDPTGRVIRSTRFRATRNLAGCGFTASMSTTQRLDVERRIVGVLATLEGDLKGTYHPLGELTEKDRELLEEDNVLFKHDPVYMEAAGVNREWPEGRGVFYNEDKTFMVWVNEEDHLQVITLERGAGADVYRMFSRLCTALELLDEKLKFAFDETLGYLSSCPTNLGTGLKLSVHIKLWKAAMDESFEGLCQEHAITLHGTSGGHSKPVDSLYDISNKHRVGIDEVEVVEGLYKGVKALLDLEASLGASSQNMPTFPDEATSLLKHYLTAEVWEELAGLTTDLGYSLRDQIVSGVENALSSSYGIYATEEQAFTLFEPLFGKVIQALHGFNKRIIHQTNMSPDLIEDLVPLEQTDDMVVQTRVHVQRNLAGHPLMAGMTSESRLEVERMCVEALNGLEGELAGTYYSMADLSAEDRDRLDEDGLLMRKTNPFLESAGIFRDWPKGRGVFHNPEKSFVVWVNSEDVLRVMSVQPGGDLTQVFMRLAMALEALEEKLTFMRDERMGFLTSCLGYLGTGMHATMQLNIPLVSKTGSFEEICREHHLESSEVVLADGTKQVWVSGSKQRLGRTEVTVAMELFEGVKSLLAQEKELRLLEVAKVNYEEKQKLQEAQAHQNNSHRAMQLRSAGVEKKQAVTRVGPVEQLRKGNALFQGGKMIWKTVTLVLNADSVTLFKKPGGKVHAKIELAHLTVVRKVESLSYGLMIKDSVTTIEVMCESDEDRDQWVEAVKGNVEVERNQPFK